MTIKKITAVLTLAAVMATTGTAFAKLSTTNPNGHGSWTYGTTQLDGGGSVISNYRDYSYNYSHSSVRNAFGRTDSATRYRGYANSSTTAIPLLTDHSYYDYWN